MDAKKNLRTYIKTDSKGALLSFDRRYRYALWRVFDPARPIVNFIGCNPSTADEFSDDMTIRRCLRFASDWGYGGLVMTNLFAFRSTYPSGLRTVDDPIGRQNDRWLAEAASISEVVVCCWGNLYRGFGLLFDRDNDVLRLIRNQATEICHLGLTKELCPRHPSRLAATARPLPFVR